ncbi:MAG: acetylornithine deacetylase/succinyl-diaminopimelate desuccinylase family protein [Granulosicoccus sp.]|nr:acetylornithine deacetylase/succinyl-diaminopimelate desuccinylase family protein [Granulosicoccus sp.]
MCVNEPGHGPVSGKGVQTGEAAHELQTSQSPTALDRRIEDAQEQLVELTQQLIRLPTVNPPGDGYAAICDLLEHYLDGYGFSVQRVRARAALGDSDRYPRWNLIARHEGRRSGECVHFNSHTDVVEAGEGWTVDPFAAQVRDGRVYGRGACDMKGGLASSVIAVICFMTEHPEYCGAVEISATCDEESGGYAGVAYLAEHGWFDPSRVQHVIIPEPLNKERICLGHRGVWWAEIETRGHMAHGSMPFLGDCAVRHMGAVIQAFETSLMPRLRGRRSAMPVVPDGARQSTLNINSIHGGLAEPDAGYTGLPVALVPDRCRMVIDRRFLVEESLSDVQDELHQLLEQVKTSRDSFDYQLKELFSVLPTMTSRDAPVVRAVADAIRQRLGVEPDYVVSPGTYDQKHIDRIGRLQNCIAYGPGILDLAHQADEFVEIQDMIVSAQVMGRTLQALLLKDSD